MEEGKYIYKLPRANSMARKMAGKDVENKMESISRMHSVPRILHQERRTCNGVVYKIYIVEFIDGTRRLYIERQATKRLPRGFVASPPAPLLGYIKSLKKLYNIS